MVFCAETAVSSDVRLECLFCLLVELLLRASTVLTKFY